MDLASMEKNLIDKRKILQAQIRPSEHARLQNIILHRYIGLPREGE